MTSTTTLTTDLSSLSLSTENDLALANASFPCIVGYLAEKLDPFDDELLQLSLLNKRYRELILPLYRGVLEANFVKYSQHELTHSFHRFSNGQGCWPGVKTPVRVLWVTKYTTDPQSGNYAIWDLNLLTMIAKQRLITPGRETLALVSYFRKTTI